MYELDLLVDFSTFGGGEDLAHRFIGATPSILQEKGAFIASPYHRRYIECRLWMTGNGLQNRDWVALDDDAVSFPVGCPNLILCTGADGFSEKDAEALRNRLEGYELQQ